MGERGGIFFKSGPPENLVAAHFVTLLNGTPGSQSRRLPGVYDPAFG